MAEKADTLKKREEMGYFFRFLYRMQREERDEILRSHPLRWGNVAEALGVAPDIQVTLDAFHVFLEQIQSKKIEYKINYMENALNELQTADIYTRQDRFLQFLFGFDDKTLSKKLLDDGEEGVDARGLLQKSTSAPLAMIMFTPPIGTQ